MAEALTPSHEALMSSSSPGEIASKGSRDRIDATKVGILALTSAISPIAGIGLLTWWAADSVTGGLLSGHNHV